eukprot:594755-Rhodomonas_salina.5
MSLGLSVSRSLGLLSSLSVLDFARSLSRIATVDFLGATAAGDTYAIQRGTKLSRQTHRRTTQTQTQTQTQAQTQQTQHFLFVFCTNYPENAFDFKLGVH